jgi:cell division protease FtsH
MTKPEGSLTLPSRRDASELARQWRTLRRAATFVALLTSPAVFLYLHQQKGWSVGWSIFGALIAVAAFRGLIDLVFKRLIPWPTLFGVEDKRMRDEDVVSRRRVWFWRFWFRLAMFVAFIITIVWCKRLLVGDGGTWLDAAEATWSWIDSTIHNPQLAGYLVILPFLFLINFLILFGPLAFMGISQIRGFEPGDADWGVRLNDVRGQAEAKEEVRRIVSLWQSGELFEEAGGKRERGLLFLGAPGTGKTMLAKAIATGFNSPFVSIPGSGFAQTFMGMDVVIVRYLARKARKLAAKWGGQCIVFIDEIDAVGMRRNALGGASAGTMRPPTLEDLLFYGPNGALNPTGDMILETRAWRERLFAERAPARQGPHPVVQRVGNIVNVMPGMMGGGQGQLALNQLLIVMDGVDNPPFFRRVMSNKLNQLLDATYVIPPRIRNASLRLPTPKPRKEQIYFIGATNVPIEALDPALTRPGRMGRHVWFRTPTKQDRLDIFDLYLGKVAHDSELDRPNRRDELSRITMGYSPAMIEQVCSLALTYAHHEARPAFIWDDIVEAMTTLESGTAIGIDYIPEETRAVAIHEAGHAAAAHVYMKGRESVRVSIRMRGGSLGHHQALEKEERFSRFRSDEVGILVWGLGAMAAERVFYGENSNGVGGDLFSVTASAAFMVGASGMGPEPIELNGHGPGYKLNGRPRRLTSNEQRDEILKRFEQIGLQIMNRTNGGGPMADNPIASVLSDPHKRKLVAQILGQAYIKAHHLIEFNKESVEKIAETIVERKEIYGDELVKLLDDAKLEIPNVDLTDEKAWPTV